MNPNAISPAAVEHGLGTATAHSQIEEWGDFSSAPIFRNLKHINSFQLIVELPKVLRVASRESSLELAKYISLLTSKVLTDAKFYALDDLRMVGNEAKGIGASYADDEFGFDVFVDNDGDLRITRQGSSFETFHDWYRGIMPSVDSFVTQICRVLASLGGFGEVSGLEPSTSPLRAQYTFGFICYDFRVAPDPTPKRNSTLMKKLLGAMPKTDGHLIGGDKAAQDDLISRIDYKVNRWQQEPTGAWVRHVYSIEAPGNRRFSTVWPEFSYIGETRTDANGQRVPFDSTPFLQNYNFPYVNFLKDRALESFLAELTEGMSFDTAAGRLP